MATSDKQLPDNHQVTVSNIPSSIKIEETEPTYTTKTNPSYEITKTVVDDTTTTTIQMTIGVTVYTKTIVKNSTTGVTTISVWS